MDKGFQVICTIGSFPTCFPINFSGNFFGCRIENSALFRVELQLPLSQDHSTLQIQNSTFHSLFVTLVIPT